MSIKEFLALVYRIPCAWQTGAAGDFQEADQGQEAGC